MRQILTTAAVLAMSALAPALRAQAPAAEPVGRPLVGVDAFLGFGFGGLVGGVSEGGGDAGVFGVGVERWLGRSTALRIEVFTGGGVTDTRETGLFSLPTKITVNHAGVSAGLRRYSSRNRFVGAGLGLVKVTACDVDTEGGPGFFGGETVACRGFADISLRPQSTVLALNASAGVRRRRFSLGARVDAGLQPSIETDEGAMRLVSIGVVAHYHFGRQ